MNVKNNNLIVRHLGALLIGVFLVGLLGFSADQQNGENVSAEGVPAGAIMAFAGPPAQIPTESDWMLCDGSILRRADYPLLYSRLGYSWGQGNTPEEFRIPDLKGRFLRGVNLQTGGLDRDPDKNSRPSAYPGGNSGNQVGSVQDDQIQLHSHSLAGSAWAVGSGVEGTGQLVRFFASKSPDENAPEYANDFPVIPEGGTETRPKNAYVHWMIKAK